jgi:hypothetical protein
MSLLGWLSLLNGQRLEGRILDSQTTEALEYVSIGIMDSPQGATTDETGFFSFETLDQPASARVRISMIGYEDRVFSLDEIRALNEDIGLTRKAIELEEVKIRAVQSERKVGATRSNTQSGWSGWGGMYIRKGYEMGTRLALGKQAVKVKSLHVRLHRQAFNTSYYRLHMRAMEDTVIGKELLNENIILSMHNESGWEEIDLTPYNLWLSGDVAMTLEWLKVEGIQQDRAMKINGRMQGAFILFKNTKGAGGLYRWGTEAPWIINEKKSPSMYLTILE